MRFLLAVLLVALPTFALACNKGFGGIDDHNPLWESTLGITFDRPFIKPSSMNGRCWVEGKINEGALTFAAKEGLVHHASAVVYSVPGIRIEPDHTTYPDNDDDAYEYGRYSKLGQDVFRIVLTVASDQNREALTKQISERSLNSEAGKDGKVENTQGEAEFGGIDVTLFTSRVKRGFLKSDQYTSAAMFTAPGNPDLLVVFLGDTNYETDRVGGIRLEETLHQALRDMEAVVD